MATTGGFGGGVDTKALYQQSFGEMSDKTCYFSGARTILKNVDLRPRMKEAMDTNFKAFLTTTGGAGTAGNAMIPVFVDSRIVDTSRKYTPLTELIPRVSNQGITADYNRVTAKGAATTAAEDAALSDVTHTRERVTRPIKFLYSIGRVTGPAIAAVPAYTLMGFQPSSGASGLGGGSVFGDSPASNALQQEVLLAARSLKEIEEQLILLGSISASVGTGPNGTEYDGLITLQGSTNTTDLSSAALTYDDVETTVRLAYDAGGRPSLAVCASSVLQDLRKIMLDTFRMGPSDNVTEIAFGIGAQLVLTTLIGRIPVIPSMFLSNTSGAKQILFLDMDFIEMRVLQDMTFEELAKTNDSRKFMLKIYEVIINRATEFSSLIDNIG